MHMKKLAAACTLAFGTIVSGGAQAIVPFDPVTHDLFISGASAVQSNFKAQLTNLFVAGFKTASDNTTTNGADFFAVTGTFKSAAPVPTILQGQTARITYRTRGGSVWGVDPVAREEKIQWMEMNSVLCSTTLPAGAVASADYYCPPTGDDTGNNGRKSDLGVSDVEPKMFQAPLNVEFGKTQLDAAHLNSLSGGPVYQQAFGVPMTNVIPTTLFLDKAMVLSMLAKTGIMHDWSVVPGAPIAAINPGQATKPVVVCRRVPGSGSQATSNYYFNNFGCSGLAYSDPSVMADSAGFGASGTGASKNDPIMIDPSVGYTVVENPGSGDVRSCLSAAQSGLNHTFKGDTGLWYQVTFSGLGRDTLNNIIYTNADTTVVGPYGATGVLSYDSSGKEGTTFHFHDLNDLLTDNTAAIAASGRPATSTAKYAVAAMMESPWEYWSEVTMQYRGPSAASLIPAKTPLADNPTVDIPQGKYSKGRVKTLADFLIVNLGDPAVVNVNLGIAALPTNYVATTVVATNKVSKGTKSGDTCKPKSLLYKPVFW